jgi:ADP-heptose:LPS heptosyltransferase
MTKHVLVVRPDGMGDVVLAGPAVRAVAARARVTMWCGPAGAAAAARLPGVERVFVQRVPWIDADPLPIDESAFAQLVRAARALEVDEAIILTSFHQSPLPTALVLRLAGVARIGAISVDYPGGLLDVRHGVADDAHEVERNLSLVRAMGHDLPAGDDDRLRLRRVAALAPRGPYVVVHPGASVPARTLTRAQWRDAVRALEAAGHAVVVTGSTRERELVDVVAAAGTDMNALVIDRFDALVSVIAAADAIAVGNTGPAHVAAAVNTPVISCFPPTVPAIRWRPWRVAHVLLGAQAVECAGCRARTCPREEQVCIADIDGAAIAGAMRYLVGASGLHADKTRRPAVA